MGEALEGRITGQQARGLDDPYEGLRRVGSWNGDGTPAKPDDAVEYEVVDYFGEPIRVLADPLSLTLTLEEFMDVAATLEGDADVRAVGAVRAFLRAMVAGEDWNKFWRLVRQHRQDLEAQMGFGKWLVGEMTGHPTEQPSASLDGRLPTEQTSGENVSSRAQRRLEQEGRPDLAAVVAMRREQAGIPSD